VALGVPGFGAVSASLLGPSGSGKTTLLRSLAGIEPVRRRTARHLGGPAWAGTSIGRVSTTLSISDSRPSLADADAVVIGVIQGPHGPVPAPGSEDVDGALGGSLAATLATLGATGQPEEVTKVASGGQLTAPLIVAVGIGTGAGAGDASTVLDGEALRRAAGAAMRAITAAAADPRASGRGGAGQHGAGQHGAGQRISLAMPARDAVEAEAVALGALLGSYSFSRYRRGGPRPPALTLLTAGTGAAAAVRRAEVLAAAMTLVRDLVNTPPSDLTPAAFASEAERVATACGLDAEVLDEKALEESGYGGILGVGQGSVHPPRLVRLEYAPPGAQRTVVFAGKGITFDSGGLSLKPSKAMETMKADMGGAAATLGAMQAISQLRPAVRVIGYLPLAENMPSGTALRPSDVLTMYGGTTVEVLNTDAEGRLVLADTLARSAADSPDLVVDVATLTGAQLVALGPRISAVMANDDSLLDAIVDAAQRAGEDMWAMPLPGELRKGLDSPVADLANVAADRYGGMLVAGLFLREFVPSGVRWAHLDIAGPAFNEGAPHGYTPKGGTGAATRTLVQIALDVADGRL
jgi:leucyl aminopeptidase